MCVWIFAVWHAMHSLAQTPTCFCSPRGLSHLMLTRWAHNSSGTTVQTGNRLVAVSWSSSDDVEVLRLIRGYTTEVKLRLGLSKPHLRLGSPERRQLYRDSVD